MKVGFEVGADINDAQNKFKQLKKDLAQLRDELKSIGTDIKIKVALDSAPVISQARHIRTNLQNAIGEVKVKLTVDAASVAADSARIKSQVQAAIGETNVKVKLDSAGLIPQLANLKTQINAYFAANTSAIRLSLSLAQADIAAIRARLTSLTGSSKIKLGIDLAHLNSQIAIARTMLASLVTGGVRINIDASATGLISALNALKVEVERLRLAMRSGGPGPGPGGGPGGLTAMTGQIMALVAGLASLAGLSVITKMSDEAALLRARFEQLLETQEEVDATQKRLYESAQRLGVSYKDMSDSAARMLPAMQQQKKGAEEAIRLAEILQVTAVLSGSTTAEAASVAQQFGQALGAGTLQAEELNSILDGNQMLARTLAEALKLPESSIEVTVGMLKKLASEGKITSEVLAAALLGSYDKIMSQADQMPKTFSRVWNSIKNLALKVVGDLNKQGFFDGAINSLDDLFKKLKDLEANGTIQEWAEGVGSTLGALGGLFIELAGIVGDVVGEIATLWSDLAGSVEEGTGAQIGFFDLLTNSIKVVHVAFIGLRTGVRLVFAAIKDTVKDTVATTVALFATFKSAINIAMITVSGSVEGLITLLQTLATVAQKALMLDFDGAVAAWDSGTEKLAQIVKKRADQIAKEQQNLKSKYQAAADTSAMLGGGADYAGIAQQGRDRINDVLLGVGTGGVKTPQGKPTFNVPKVAVGAGSSMKADSDAKKAAEKAAEDLARAKFEHEQALLKIKLDNNQQEYEAYKISAEKYYQQRLTLTHALAQNEIDELDKRHKNAKNESERQEIDTQILKIEEELKDTKALILAEHRDMQQGMRRESDQLNIDLARAEGKSYDARIAEIKLKYDALIQSLKQQGRDSDVAIVVKIKRQEEMQAKADDIGQRTNRIINDQRDKENVLNRAKDEDPFSTLTLDRAVNDTRQNAVNQLMPEKDNLKQLQDAGHDVTEQMQQLNASILELQQNVPTTFQQFSIGMKQAVGTALTSGLTDLFTSVADGSKSAGEAMEDFAKSFIKSIAQIIIQAMAAYAALLILNTIPGGKAVASALDIASTAGSAQKVTAEQKHSGGTAGSGGVRRTIDASAYLGAPRYHVGGIAGLAPGEIPAVLMKGEEVLTEDDPRHVANGGGQMGTSVKIINGVDESVIHDNMQSSNGEKVIMNIIGRNASTIKRLLG